MPMALIRRTTLYFFAPLLLPLLISCKPSVADEQRAITKAWKNYKEAIFYHKGEEAWPLLNDSTQQYYSRILLEIRTYDSTNTAALNFTVKIPVLMIRHVLTAKEVAQLSSKSLFVW